MPGARRAGGQFGRRPTAHPGRSVMSNTAPPGAAPPSIEQQIEALSRLSEDLHRSLARGRVARLALLAAFVVLVAVTLVAFNRLGNKVRSDEYLNQLQAAAQKRFDENTDRYVKHLEMLAEDAGPALRDAFSKQADQDAPGILKAMEAESNAFSAGMKEQLTRRVEEHSRKAVARHEAILRAEFPQINNDEQMHRMTANLGTAMERTVKKYYVTQLDEQMQALYGGWSKFPAAPAPGKGEPPLNDLLIADLQELLTHRLTQPDTAALR
jgi:hypothetical protein